MEKKVFLIGTGQMALDYFAVLKGQNFTTTVIGRGEESAIKFESKTGVIPFTGGFDEYINKNGLPENAYVIIATGTEILMPVLLSAVKAGAHKILVEKPAAISIQELIENEEKLKSYSENIFVAYNRRFYASVIEAKKMIEEDGGLQTIHFEFTEWAHVIGPLEKAPGVKENWFFANSTHVVDLAFYLAGKPAQWQAYSKAGALEWHSKVKFTGAGITENGVLFSYLSNWESAGRWGVEMFTEKRRIILTPLEKVFVQNKGSMLKTEYQIDNLLDINYKPGLFLQTKAFIENKSSEKLLEIMEHIKMSKIIYFKILNGI